jgi:hypothetical protein
MNAKFEVKKDDGSIVGGYFWNRKKKKNAIEVRINASDQQSFVLINAFTREIVFMGDINFRVKRVKMTRNGAIYENLFTEDEWSKEIARRL